MHSVMLHYQSFQPYEVSLPPFYRCGCGGAGHRSRNAALTAPAISWHEPPRVCSEHRHDGSLHFLLYRCAVSYSWSSPGFSPPPAPHHPCLALNNPLDFYADTRNAQGDYAIFLMSVGVVAAVVGNTLVHFIVRKYRKTWFVVGILASTIILSTLLLGYTGFYRTLRSWLQVVHLSLDPPSLSRTPDISSHPSNATLSLHRDTDCVVGMQDEDMGWRDLCMDRSHMLSEDPSSSHFPRHFPWVNVVDLF